ncbi:MAG: hypothetical protein MI975_26640 [Cytophagales bacterium]|nr:hypothetical protein [Cytophagales bacterium]
MNRLFYRFSAVFILSFVFLIFACHAEEASRRVTKQFNINRDTRIEISNKYGNVIINRWDKNVLDLKVDIEARGNSATKTQKILDGIEIDISDRISSGGLSIETEIGNMSGNSSFSVHYEITMPNTNPLELSNSFGSIYMGSYQGDLDAVVKYGQFQAEDLSNANIRIEFSTSRCEIETLKAGRIDLRYSKMSIEEMGDIEISSQFSELEIEEAGTLELDGRYGKFEIEKLKSLKGDLQFSGLDIEYLGESLLLDSRHGNGIKLENVSNRFKEIEIESEFSSVGISLESGASARLIFKLQHGNLRANGEGINFDKVIKDYTSSAYEGFLRDKNSDSSIRVATRHGNIKFEVN